MSSNERKEKERDEGASPVTHEAFGPEMSAGEQETFTRGLRALNEAGIPYLVGGAFAKHTYTNIWRRTKDLDLYLRPDDLRRALDVLKRAGFSTEVVYPQWLAKAHDEPHLIDLIFGTGHGQVPVTDQWFERSKRASFAGLEVQLAPREELLASMFYVMERNRFDGPEINHLILKSENLDWDYLDALMGQHRLLLLIHLLHFAFVYPGQTNRLPQELMRNIFEEELAGGQEVENPKAFRGTLLDPFSYLVDIEDWGYEDRREMDPLVDDSGQALGIETEETGPASTGEA